MQSVKKTIKITRTARYFVLGEPGPHIEHLWFVCHGYGQLAEPFLEEFQLLDDGRTLVIAPEALHRFYIRGTREQVGASWMTKVERSVDINDYVAYLDSVYQNVMCDVKKNPADVNIHILGFSQGAATAWRWAVHGRCQAKRLILWAGDVPPDTDWENCKKRFEEMELLLVFGEKDPMIKPGFIQTQKELLELHDISIRVEAFDGVHEIKAEVLEKLRG